MDGLEEEVIVVVVVDVLATEASGGTTSTDGLPLVVVVGDAELASIDLAEDIAVANER